MLTLRSCVEFWLARLQLIRLRHQALCEYQTACFFQERAKQSRHRLWESLRQSLGKSPANLDTLLRVANYHAGQARAAARRAHRSNQAIRRFRRHHAGL